MRNAEEIKSLSKSKAILDIYPVVSNSDIHKNNIINCGMKPKTAPTPAIIPSTTKLFTHSDVPAFSRKAPVHSPSASILSATQSTVPEPTTPTDK